MKNLLKTFIACAAFLIAASASAGTLYWQVQNDDTAFDEAYLMVKDNNGGTTSQLVGVAAQADKHTTAPSQTTIDAYESSGYSFFVELVNYTTGSEDKNWVVAKGQEWSYEDLVSGGYIATGLEAGTMPLGGSLNMGVAGAIPEPSSGLLLLIGGAMLALRRRRQQ